MLDQKFYHLLMPLRTLMVFILCITSLTGCEKDDGPIKPLPAISDVEIGLGNNEMGIIGRDFHFDAHVVAGDKIETIEVKILPRTGESYSKDWKLEITWEQFRGAKNATVHKHFDIPSDAVEGAYDFLIIVSDQNGTQLEEKRNVTLYAPENLPVDLRFDFGIEAVDENFKHIKTLYVVQNIFSSQIYKSEEVIMKNEFLAPVASMAGVKGDGKMYCLMINKKHNHRPESIDAIDFSKAVVAHVWEHKGLLKSEYGSNMFDFSTDPLSILQPSIKIGTNMDNNRPAQSIDSLKEWESGDYYVGFVYHNSTYNMGTFHYAEVSVILD
jgi:hypothetical protein